MAKRSDIRIGISGWRYRSWRGVFYPEDLPQKNELAFAAQKFRTIEINGTFYSLQRPSSFAHWAEETPDDFAFAIKGSRYLTHNLRLKNTEKALANFFASGFLRLGRKLGPILWQLPPSFKFDADRLSQFFEALPRTGKEAAALARRHDARVKGRSWMHPEPSLRIRHALEIRNDSFRTEKFISLLRRHKIALVCADAVEWPRLMDVTADFIYCRLHGSEQLYASGYSDAALRQWARRALAWSEGGQAQGDRISAKIPPRRPRDVFIYFDNDAKVRAPADAASLMRKIARRREN